MRVLVAMVTGVAMGALILGPISHIRAQQWRTVRPADAPSSPAIPSPTDESSHASPASSIQVTDEFVRPKVVRSPAVEQPAAKARPQIHRKVASQRRSIWARLFLGAGENRPKPFPRPRS